MLAANFFDRDACTLAQRLIGKIIRHKMGGMWLCARIIETEAYYLTDKASHASLGYTEKRKALFQAAGTIYMYYARGRDSLNVSARGDGNAVLIKSAYPECDSKSLTAMQRLNPDNQGRPRPVTRLCAGQTLLCRALGLRVSDWDGGQFDPERLLIDDPGEPPPKLIQTTRLGIPVGRDEHLPYRFVDYDSARHCSRNPLTCRSVDYTVIAPT